VTCGVLLAIVYSLMACCLVCGQLAIRIVSLVLVVVQQAMAVAFWKMVDCLCHSPRLLWCRQLIAVVDDSGVVGGVLLAVFYSHVMVYLVCYTLVTGTFLLVSLYYVVLLLLA